MKWYKRGVKQICYWIAYGLCISVFLFSGFQVVSKLWGYHASDRSYQTIRNQIERAEPLQRFEAELQPANWISVPDTNTQHAEEQTLYKEQILPYQVIPGNPDQLGEQGVLKEYEKLKAQNGDMAGWISMPGYKKPIDYPIMWADNNGAYLYKDFYNNDSHAGSIFMEAANDPTAVPQHMILYGHAMRDYSMFGNLREYNRNPDDYLNKTKIYIDLLDTRLEYEVFSAYTAEADYNYRQTVFENDEAYLAFLERNQKLSVHDYGLKLGPKDKILTLSTCDEYIHDDGRSVVHARLVKQMVYDGSSGEAAEAGAADETKRSAKKPILANVYVNQLTLSYTLGESVADIDLVSSYGNISKQFSVEVPAQARAVSLTMKTADPEARIQVTVNGKRADLDGELSLAAGENEIRLNIISRDLSYARRYTINVLRLSSDRIE